VPQGSIGAPLLFLLFINDITDLPLKGKITLSADDTTLTESAKNFEDLERYTNHDLDLIKNWLHKNRLLLNSDKSSFMIMGRPRNSTNMNIKFGSDLIKRVFEMKVLGVVINPDLSFKSHILKISKTIGNRINFLKRISDFLPSRTLQLVYNAIVLPYFDYCNTVWGHTCPTHTDRLRTLQRRASRVLLKERNDYSWSEAFKRLNWMPIKSRINFHSVIYIYKAMNNMASTLSTSFFTYATTRSSSRISDDKKLSVIRPNNDFYKHSIFYDGIQLYNSMSYEIRSSDLFSTFKRLLYTFYE
jgi:hypothetical protein